ncbi:MAG: PaaI family thioesterase [Pseudomonadota bacterium]
MHDLPKAHFAGSAAELLSPADLASMTGLDFIRGMAEGRLPAPPICEAMNFRLEDVAEGRAVFVGIAEFRHYNPIGTVHGGWVGTMLDSCMACAVQTTLAAGRGYTTLEFKVNIVRPIFESTGPLRAIGTVSHSGRRTAVAEGRLEAPAGTLFATGSTTCLVMDLRA